VIGGACSQKKRGPGRVFWWVPARCRC